MSLAETARFAEKIAQKYHLDEETLEKIGKAYEPMAKIYKKTGKSNDSCYKECIEIMRKYKRDKDIYKAGERYLSKANIKKHIENLAKKDPYWKKALDFMAKQKKERVAGLSRKKGIFRILFYR